MNCELVLENCRAVFDGKPVKCSIGIEDGKIAAVKKKLSGEKSIDCSHKLVLPGMLDLHVHFREPGMEWKADWVHESKAALHGGVTCVGDMPNNKPGICTSELLEQKRKLVSRKAGVDYCLHFGASAKKLLEIHEAQNYGALKVFMGSSTGDLLVDRREDQFDVFTEAKRARKIVMVHAEDNSIIESNLAKAKKMNWTSVKFHSKIRSPEAEFLAVKQALELSEKAGNRLHVCHVSNSESIGLIEKTRDTGLVSCGVTPNHLFLSGREAVDLGNRAKLNPALGTRANRRELWLALNSGKIDLIESDHAPHTLKEKKQDYLEAPSGIPGVETTLPLLIDAFHRKLVSLETIVECCCHNPARIFGVKEKGFLKVGFDADLVLVDLKKEWKVDAGDLFTKCGWSPFEDRVLRGKIEQVFLRGEPRYEEGTVYEGKGKEIEMI